MSLSIVSIMYLNYLNNTSVGDPYPFLGLRDPEPDPLVRGADPDPDFPFFIKVLNGLK